MNPTLEQLKCNSDYSDSKKLSEEELTTFLEQLPEWELKSVDDVHQICRCYRRKNFEHALHLAHMIGKSADEQDHHPTILVEWGSVTVTWWTHALGGLHLNDFIMAAKCDQLVSTNAS